jgi:dsRNA-specific ribonuclease
VRLFIDPPKAISDTVEAVFGAVHVDGGFVHGQAAVLQLLSPILQVLLKAQRENRKISLMHPKKVMQEMGGEMLELNASTESDFAGESSTDVLFGSNWGHAKSESSNYISTVEVMGSTVVAVSDPSLSVARNKACALVVGALQSNSALTAKLQSYRTKVESSFSRSANCLKSSNVYDDEADDTLPA